LHPIFRTIRHPFRRRGGFPALVVLLLAVLLLAACGAAATDTPAPQPGAPSGATATAPATARTTGTASATATVRATRTPKATATPHSIDGLPVIAYDDLPREAHETLRLIERGGPFPYRQDGSTFQNRERLLPRKPGGYYREYTVETPGEDDRGARRIVAGEEGELYYTDDHYSSFRRVVQ
jgi:ribonuclease T1